MASNYLLFITSLMRPDANPIEYSAADCPGITFESAQTNVPAAEYVIQKLHEKGEKLTRIVMLCSEEVKNNGQPQKGFDSPVTSCEYLMNKVSQWLRQYGYTEGEIKGSFYPIDLNGTNPGHNEGMNNIINELEHILVPDEGEKPSLYLDYTGGQRSASMLLVFLSRFLQWRGVEVKDVLYSNISKGGTGSIESCMDTYRNFNWLDAITCVEHGDTKTAAELAERDGHDAVAKQFRELQKKMAARETDNAEITIDETLPLWVRSAFHAARERMKSMSKERLLQTLIEDQAYQTATSYVYERGITMLKERGLISWRWPGGKDKDAFVAYSLYYTQYLAFAYQFLRSVNFCSDYDDDGRETNLRESLKSYMKEKLALKPVDKRKQWMVFNNKDFEELKEVLPEAAAEADRWCEGLDEKETKEYRERLLAAYYSGFPFGNRPDRKSYTICGEQKEQNYPQAYREALEQAISALAELPAKEREEKLKSIRKYDLYFNPNKNWKKVYFYADEFARVFPPVELPGLFKCADGFDRKELGVFIMLYDYIRLLRNAWSHDAITEEGVKLTEKLLGRLLNWLAVDRSAPAENAPRGDGTGPAADPAGIGE